MLKRYSPISQVTIFGHWIRGVVGNMMFLFVLTYRFLHHQLVTLTRLGLGLELGLTLTDTSD